MVLARLKESFPQALFVHWYAHTLNIVMFQGASKIEDCKICFCKSWRIVCIFYMFFQTYQIAEWILQKEAATSSTPGWWARSMTKELVELLHILDHAEDFDREMLQYAPAHSFFLLAFIGIFDFADVLFGILQNKILDM